MSGRRGCRWWLSRACRVEGAWRVGVPLRTVSDCRFGAAWRWVGGRGLACRVGEARWVGGGGVSGQGRMGLQRAGGVAGWRWRRVANRGARMACNVQGLACRVGAARWVGGGGCWGRDEWPGTSRAIAAPSCTRATGTSIRPHPQHTTTANLPRRPNTARKIGPMPFVHHSSQHTATANPPRCSNTARKTFGPMLSPFVPAPTPRHCQPTAPPQHGTQDLDRPPTTTPPQNGTPTRRTTAPRPPATLHNTPLTRHAPSTWHARLSHHQHPRLPDTARKTPPHADSPPRQDPATADPPRRLNAARNTPPPANSPPHQDPAIADLPHRPNPARNTPPPADSPPRQDLATADLPRRLNAARNTPPPADSPPRRANTARPRAKRGNGAQLS
ncbi:hypothetical protein EDB84DRAFT_1446385 [Lactarius hengduanensis]|nr:hypothetical protein EDB84DRAFT_1446385 [Lactarius hengduanensis]